MHLVDFGPHQFYSKIKQKITFYNKIISFSVIIITKLMIKFTSVACLGILCGLLFTDPHEQPLKLHKVL